MPGPRYDARPGEFYRECDRTGFKVKASHTQREWNGLIVRRDSWEPRHPQDYLRARPDHPAVPDPRPVENLFLSSMLQKEDGGSLLMEQGAILQKEDAETQVTRSAL